MDKDELDKYAQENFKKPKREPVDKQLADDLVRWRTALFNDLKQWNSGKEYTEQIIAKAVQQLLDRLIFIRTTEDRQIEGEGLRELVRNWEENKNKISLGEELKKLFARYNDDYDSRLFELSGCDKLEYEDSLFADIIKQLYKNKKGIRYDFASINADILGSIYEQYLGQIQESEKNKSKRKSQGIYYTPRYIVDYIVKNTLGEVLKGKSGHEATKIKILDPACGSGSFLIKAFEVLDNHIKRENNQNDAKQFTNYARKVGILTSNIYGVDLDEEAVEVAQLNLLLKALEFKELLPNLGHNIENGNSLISGTPKELEKYFGKNWKVKKPFNWEEKFPEVFRQGGFDVVIGNPPYIKELDNKELFEPIKNSEYQKYYQGKMDFWYFFLHRAIDVCKTSGYIGFITNSYFLKSAGAAKLINRIKNELVLIKAIDFEDIKVFGDVSGRHIIHIYQKRPAVSSDKTIYIKEDKELFANFINEQNPKAISYQKIFSGDKISFDLSTTLKLNKCVELGEIFNVSQGVVEATDKVSKKMASEDFKGGEGIFVLSKKELAELELNKEEQKSIKKYLNTNNVLRYGINFDNDYLIYSDKETKQKIAIGELPKIKEHLDKMSKFITSSNKPYGLHRPREIKYFENSKLICKGMFLTPEFTYDDEKYYVGFSFSVIISQDKNYSLKYLLALLNSNFGKYWFNVNGKKRGVGVDIGVLVFRQFPVFKANINKQNELVILVDRMLKLNRELKNFDPILYKEEYEEKKKEIEKTDKEIDQMVYKLYGLTPEEIKIIEN